MSRTDDFKLNCAFILIKTDRGAVHRFSTVVLYSLTPHYHNYFYPFVYFCFHLFYIIYIFYNIIWTWIFFVNSLVVVDSLDAFFLVYVLH